MGSALRLVDTSPEEEVVTEEEEEDGEFVRSDMKGKEERWTLNEQAGGGAGSRKRGFDQLLEE